MHAFNIETLQIKRLSTEIPGLICIWLMLLGQKGNFENYLAIVQSRCFLMQY